MNKVNNRKNKKDLSRLFYISGGCFWVFAILVISQPRLEPHKSIKVTQDQKRVEKTAYKFKKEQRGAAQEQVSELVSQTHRPSFIKKSDSMVKHNDGFEKVSNFKNRHLTQSSHSFFGSIKKFLSRKFYQKDLATNDLNMVYRNTKRHRRVLAQSRNLKHRLLEQNYSLERRLSSASSSKADYKAKLENHYSDNTDNVKKTKSVKKHKNCFREKSIASQQLTCISQQIRSDTNTFSVTGVKIDNENTAFTRYANKFKNTSETTDFFKRLIEEDLAPEKINEVFTTMSSLQNLFVGSGGFVSFLYKAWELYSKGTYHAKKTHSLGTGQTAWSVLNYALLQDLRSSLTGSEQEIARRILETLLSSLASQMRCEQQSDQSPVYTPLKIKRLPSCLGPEEVNTKYADNSTFYYTRSEGHYYAVNHSNPKLRSVKEIKAEYLSKSQNAVAPYVPRNIYQDFNSSKIYQDSSKTCADSIPSPTNPFGNNSGLRGQNGLGLNSFDYSQNYQMPCIGIDIPADNRLLPDKLQDSWNNRYGESWKNSGSHHNHYQRPSVSFPSHSNGYTPVNRGKHRPR